MSALRLLSALVLALALLGAGAWVLWGATRPPVPPPPVAPAGVVDVSRAPLP